MWKCASVSLCTSSLSVLMVLPGGSSVVGVFGALGVGPLLLVMANAALWWRYRVMIPRVLLTIWCMPSFSKPPPNGMRNKEREMGSIECKQALIRCWYMINKRAFLNSTNNRKTDTVMCNLWHFPVWGVQGTQMRVWPRSPRRLRHRGF